MAHLRLHFACLAVLLALAASSASAAACPAEQDFSGNLTPGATVSVPVTTTARGDTYFIFMPKACSDTGLQTVTMRLAGNSMTGDCGLGIVLNNAPSGTYTVQLHGDYLNVNGLALLPYKLIVYQSHCSA